MTQLAIHKKADFKSLTVNESTYPCINTPTFRVSGLIVELPVGENVVPGNMLYMDATTAELMLADADVAAKIPALCMALATGANAEVIPVLLMGYIWDPAQTLTVSGEVYLSATPGAYTQSAPGGGNDQILGMAISTTEWIFRPQQKKA